MISVCMATYNGEKYIKEQIDSILAQIGDNDELIISDDGSTDNTIAIIESYKDDRIKVLYNFGKHGCNANFENALKRATGDYIFLSDQDDVWISKKVNKCIEALQSADLVVHDCFVSDADLNIIEPSFFNVRKSKPGVIYNLIRNSYVGACMAFKRDILTYSLPIPKSLLMYHDGWIALLVSIKGKVQLLPTPLIYFRRHYNNTSQSASQSSFSILYQIRYRLNWWILLFLRIINII